MGVASRIDNWKPTKLQVFILLGLVIDIYVVVAVLVGSWLLNYSNEQYDRRKQHDAIAAKCKTMGANYDNGTGELPTCRTPISDKEWQAILEQRAYREGLRNGDVDPDTGDPFWVERVSLLMGWSFIPYKG